MKPTKHPTSEFFRGIDINTKTMNKIFTLAFLALMPLLAMADDQGTCGENVTWTYTESTKTLSIQGTGAMDDYTLDTPWHTHNASITTIEIGDGVTTVGQGTFVLCTAVTSVSIPNSVKSIGEGAFAACAVMKSITIPASVTAISDDVFLGCIYLEAINVEATTPPSIGSNVFSNVSADAKIYVPVGSEEAYKTSWSSYADMIVGNDTGIDDVNGNQRKNVSKGSAKKYAKNGKLFIKAAKGNFTVGGAEIE